MKSRARRRGSHAHVGCPWNVNKKTAPIVADAAKIRCFPSACYRKKKSDKKKPRLAKDVAKLHERENSECFLIQIHTLIVLSTFVSTLVRRLIPLTQVRLYV